MKRIFLLLTLTLSWSSLESMAGELPARMDVLDMGTLATGRPEKINLWYPRGDCPGKKTRLCLADAAVTDEVVVFSHGAMGSAEEYSWLGESLAAAGYVVIGANHYGESRIYGDPTRDPRTCAFTWQRPQDISALLDRLSGDNPFQKAVDWNHVVAIGHSEGGQTAALLAGARFDLRQLARYCESAAAESDRSCSYGRDRVRAPDSFVALFDGDYQDARIRKIILLDPALGSGVRDDSLRGISLPSLVVGASHDDFLPWEAHGGRYAAGIPGSRTLLLQGQEGHFVFLDPCEYPVTVMGVPLCQDRPGVDRKAVHRELAGKLIAFLRLDNEPDTVTQHPGVVRVSKASFARDLNLLEILRYTPHWVFGLLAGLSVFGWMQTRTRRVALPLALFLPAAMVILSLTGVIRYSGWQVPALAAWLFGVGVAATLCRRLMDPGTARYESESRRLIVEGSWVPMLIILAIFLTRYALGVASAIQLPVIKTWYFSPAASLVLGASSGFFLARGLLFWGVRQPTESASKAPGPS